MAPGRWSQGSGAINSGDSGNPAGGRELGDGRHPFSLLHRALCSGGARYRLDAGDAERPPSA